MPHQFSSAVAWWQLPAAAALLAIMLTELDWVFHFFAAFGVPFNQQWRLWGQEIEYNVLIVPFWTLTVSPRLTLQNLTIRACLSMIGADLALVPLSASHPALEQLATIVLAAVIVAVTDLLVARLTVPFFKTVLSSFRAQH